MMITKIKIIGLIATFHFLHIKIAKADPISFTCDAQHRLSNFKAPTAEIKKQTDFYKNANEAHFKKYGVANNSICKPIDKNKLTKIAHPSPKCTLTYLNDSPYMNITGRRFDNSNLSTPPVQCNDLDQFIDDALLANQDPYSALAISLMENGSNISGLYLDPIGIVDGLGCKGSVSSKSQSNLNSFETYYKINFSENTKNKSLSDEIKVALGKKQKELNIEIKNESGFICSNHISVTFEKTKLSNKCCIQIDYYPVYKGKINTSDWDDPISTDSSQSMAYTQLASKIMTFRSLNNKYLTAPLPATYNNKSAEEKVAFRAQRYNGLRSLSGGAENMPMWRSGVNYTEDPAYGYQAIDYVLNSLMTNPMLKNKIEAAEKKLNKKTASLLCLDRKPGSYSLDHDYYFKKHKSSKRMESIYQKWTDKKNLNFSSLAETEKKVLKKEFEVLCTYESVKNAYSKIKEFTTFTKNCNSPEKQFPIYMSALLPLRNTIEKTSKMEHGYSWEPMDNKRTNELIKRMTEEW
jgi:hypothetical protein